MFDAKRVKDEIVEWITDWFEENGNGCKAVVGVSGGKDSSVVAALCVAALGKDRVIGVLMPNGEQSDIKYSHMLCDHLGIKNYTVNVGPAINGVLDSIHENAADIEVTEQATTNLPARIRMATLYAVSQSVNGRNVPSDYCRSYF